MKHRHHTKQQISQILADAKRYDGPIRQFCKDNGISEQNYYRWKRQSAANETVSETYLPEMLVGPDTTKSEIELIRENESLKKIIGELLLEQLNLKRELQKHAKRAA